MACDALYGRGNDFRKTLNDWNLRYAAQVPVTTLVYLNEPHVGIPTESRSGSGRRIGRKPTRLRVLSREEPLKVRDIGSDPGLTWQRVKVRPTERGWLEADFAVLRIWTVAPNCPAHPESGPSRGQWLVVRREQDGESGRSRGHHQYTLLNDPPSTPPMVLIRASCQRCWVERIFEDAKSELGWDEFQAQKYLAWKHHFVLPKVPLGDSFIAMVYRSSQTSVAYSASTRPKLARSVER